MATKRSPRAQIKIVTRHGHTRPHVRWRFLDLEGASAVLFIAIILAARIFRAIFRFADPRVRCLLARFARSSAHSIALGYATFRAFYVP